MIYGRPTALWLGLLQAVLNVIAAIWIVATGQPLTEQLIALFAALNTLGAAVVAVLANVTVNGSFFGRNDPEKTGRRD